MYKGGRLPRSLMADIGEVDLAGALAVSSNPYFAILAGDFLEEPLELNEAAIAFGYGRKTGIDLPGEAKGQLPSDLEGNKTGLYSYAIGQHTLLATPLQAACMLMRVAMRGEGWRPQVAKMSLTAAPNREGLDAFAESRLGLQRELKKLGLDYPLFTALAPQEEAVGRLVEREPIQEEKIPIGERLWREIVEGLDACVWGGKGPRSIRTLRSRPEWMADYMSLEHQMVGKTGTAEVLYNPYPLPSSTPNMYKHIWFGAIAFPENKRWEDPELVVVVMLRFGDAGKEAAPLAAQVIKKWREIRSRERGS
jgi:cell division protein FtsI/penicillin-binding protein 2